MVRVYRREENEYAYVRAGGLYEIMIYPGPGEPPQALGRGRQLNERIFLIP